MKVRHLVVGTVVTLWTVIVLSAYYVVHRPWPQDGSMSAILAIFDILVAIALTSLAGGIGELILGRLNFGAPIEQAAVKLGMGVGIIGLSLFGIGIIGLLRNWIIWVLTIAGIFILRKYIWLWYQNVADVQNKYQRAGVFGKIVAFVVLVMVLMSLLLALAPPLKWDSLVYHLEIPKEYLKSGRILYLADNQFVGSPQLVEMNFTAAMAFGSGRTAATYGWVVGVLALLGVGGLAGRLFGPGATFLAPMILLTGESISEGLSWAYVDLWVLLFGLSLIVILDYYNRTRDRRLLIVAAAYAGFGASVKYTGGLLLIMGVALLIFDAFKAYRKSREETARLHRERGGLIPSDRKRELVRTHLQTISIFVIVATLILSPWLLKNFAFTGNPFYPFIFEGGAIDSLQQSFYIGAEPQRTLVDDLTLPWNATILGVEDSPGFSSSIGPLMLASIPAVFFTIGLKKKRDRKDLFQLIVIASLGWLLWAIGSHYSSFLNSTRLYYGIFPAFAVLACAGIEFLKDIEIPKIRIRIVVQGLVILSITLSLVSMTYLLVKRNPLPVVLGIQSRDDYLFQQLGWYLPAMNAINALPPNSKVAFLWESRAYYCDIECSPDVVIARWWYLSRSVGDVEGIARLLNEDGVTHILVYKTGRDFVKSKNNLFLDEDWSLLDRFTESELAKVEDFGEAYSLLSLNYE